MEQIKSGASVLILHNNCCDSLNKLKTELDSKKVSTEIKPIGNIQELEKTSTFDVVIVHEANKFSNILNIFTILKPDGIFILNQITSEASNSELELKVNGFTNITSKQIGEYTEFVAVKPKYDVGSSAKLNLKKPAAVWKLDDDDAEETIDPDNLLDEDDLKKPAADSLRVCGTTGKRKACKDCSCGLAEELAGEVTDAKDTSNAKSSCGSCYLGDAFRCASCPYLGMPAFKPGEKIQLSANLLKDDI